MATQVHPSSTAISYAQALLELAQERKLTEQVGAELADLRKVIEANPTFGEFLRDPGIGAEERSGVIDRVIKPRVNPLLANFIGVLLVHGRIGLLGQISQAYADLVDRLTGKVEVEVTVPQRLSDAELDQVRQRVNAALGKQSVVQQHVDDSLIGGLVLRVGDKLIDASVRTQLETMRRQFIAARPR
jgi:F-type H+-transporting ATPase subunit delta